MQVFHKKCLSPSVVCAFQRIISTTRYSINQVENDTNKQLDKNTNTANVSDTQKSKCIDEKQNKKDKKKDNQGSNLTKAIKKMNDNYD